MDCKKFCEVGHLEWRQKKDPIHMEDPDYFITRSISNDCPKCLEESLKYFGFDPRKYWDLCGQTVIHLCAIWSSVKCLKYLVEELGLIDLVDVSSPFNTPLMMCLEQRRYQYDSVAKLLISYGADLDKKDSEGKTPRYVIERQKKMEEERFSQYDKFFPIKK